VAASRTGEGPTVELTVAAVAHRLGVAPATLRTWDRRYGLGPSRHASGTHRRYGPDDVARLEVMRRLVAEGVAPKEAARAARAGALPDPAPAPPRPASLAQAEGLVRGLARAAHALDVETVVSAVATLLAEHGVVATWDRVLVPVLVGAGVRWETTGEGVDVEHLLSQAITTALERHLPAAPQPPRPVLLACAPDDLHELPLRVLAAALAETGHGCRFLGAAVPADALRAAVRRTGAAVVVVWAQRAETADVSVLDLPPTRPATTVLAAGPGWVNLPARVPRPGGLGAAVALVSQALSGKPIPFPG
jgi:DNA-binding transcriptional MerR regulator